MKKIMMMLLTTLPLLATANDTFENGTFEITQENCNLPMDKIRQILPEKTDQQEALKRCMEKSTEERWMRQQNLTSN